MGIGNYLIPGYKKERGLHTFLELETQIIQDSTKSSETAPSNLPLRPVFLRPKYDDCVELSLTLDTTIF